MKGFPVLLFSLLFLAIILLGITIIGQQVSIRDRPVRPMSISLNESSTSSPSSSSDETTDESPYPWHRQVIATMFWVGEKATGANDYIPNKASAWDKDWLENFGGIDNPYSRHGFFPKNFIPKENPFYVALPYNDLTGSGKKPSAFNIPWYQPTDPYQSVLKNRWVKVQHGKRVCYGQWEDVGPFTDDDYSYVFGKGSPTEKRAGIDLSPAMRTCLQMVNNAPVNWRFVEESEVPSGPWKETLTSSPTNW